MAKIATNIADGLSRVIGQMFNAQGTGLGNASSVLVGNPNTFTDANGAVMGLKLAMGESGPDCILSLVHSENAAITFTLWEWSEMWYLLTGNGWIHAGYGAAVYEQSVDPNSKASFSIANGVKFCVTASAPVVNLGLAGCKQLDKRLVQVLDRYPLAPVN